MTRFAEGDLIRCPEGNSWNVVGYREATEYLPAVVTVGKTTADGSGVHSVIRDFPAADCELIARLIDRTVIIRRRDGLMIFTAKNGDVLATYNENEERK